MIKLIEQPKENNTTTLSDLSTGDVFMLRGPYDEVFKDNLYMRIKQEQDSSYLCWNFSENHSQYISLACRVHLCSRVTLRYAE